MRVEESGLPAFLIGMYAVLMYVMTCVGGGALGLSTFVVPHYTLLKVCFQLRHEMVGSSSA